MGAALALMAGAAVMLGCGSEPEAPRVCTVDDLELHTEVRPGDATKRELRAGDALALGLVVFNRCGSPIEFQTPHLCLAHSFRLIEPGGSERVGDILCSGEPRTWTIPHESGESVRFELGILAAGAYSVEVPVTFSDQIGKAEFEVPERLP
ncbi:MAG: hypothetical protein GY898_24965 [Proteobacteria bacterium]|nr:hypothetical protein [Pseudomonadota bacterium]